MEHLGPYRITGLLGEGGMAVVYAARHSSLGVERAIKVMAASSPVARRRLAREARVQRRLAHPNVLPILDVLELPGRMALVLPLVEGPTLARLLGSHRPSEAEAADLFRQIVAGVAAIHGAGLVHRDLKPGNVLLDPSGAQVRALVADFGLARSVGLDESRITRSGVVVGTPAYMAPEQVAGAAPDRRADLWALGAIGYELVSGRRWSRAGDLGLLPAPWRPLLERLLQADPALRPADATELAAALPSGDTGEALLGACRALRPVPKPIAPEDPQTWALDTPDAHLVGVPTETDEFVGRDVELVEIAGLLADGPRAVTVAGLGGVGKTRLVARYATIFGGDWSGVWFVDLAGAQTSDDVVRAVASRLEVDPGSSVAGTLAERGRTLLVLDRVEAVSEPVARLLDLWLAGAPELAVLATSRRPIGAPGERVWLLDPLPTDDARSLLLDRAAALRPGWGAEARDDGAVRALVTATDGLPLGLELVAALARDLAPAEALSALASDPGLASLLAPIEESWRLLSGDERSVLAQLSVFDGPFGVDDAEEVARLDEGWVPDALNGLVARGLVRHAPREQFDLLRLVRTVARSRLAEQPAERAGAEERRDVRSTRTGRS